MDKIVSGIWCLIQFDLGGSSRTKRMPPKNLGTILLTGGGWGGVTEKHILFQYKRSVG